MGKYTIKPKFSILNLFYRLPTIKDIKKVDMRTAHFSAIIVCFCLLSLFVFVGGCIGSVLLWVDEKSQVYQYLVSAIKTDILWFVIIAVMFVILCLLYDD